ncbi:MULTISPECIES: hypothetical protein [unclassified Nocardia]|uniref:hypothetical protein n=1 Tax=unclassified Nocardia TaxID=2637762 RepID=UPI001CE4A62C|nr:MULTISPECIES: hypothetical protein [unclassified Nocardia]
MATAILTIAATGITAATAYGQAEVAGPTTINGVDGQVGYTTTVAQDRSSATVKLTSGKFTLVPGAVAVAASDGSVVGSIPTELRTAAGQIFDVTPALDATATTLTLTPVGGPVPGVANSPEAVALQQIGNAGTTIAGVAIGCAVGIVIGIFFFFVGAIIGCVVGAVIGGIIGANQP